MSTGPLAPPSLRALLLAAVGGLALTAWLVSGGWTWRMDAHLYDLATARMGPQVEGRMVVVAIDQQSLAELGRWPWPRSTHARLLDVLGTAGARGVALDLLFVEPAEDPAQDRALAQAIERMGHVVLPIHADETAPGGAPVELLPIDPLSRGVVLGHAEIPLDRDGVARASFLRAGLGSPYWPSLAVALVRPDAAADTLPGKRNPHPSPESPLLWVRDNEVLVPYVRPPDDFLHLSYVDALHGRFPPQALRDAWVVVGMTASGLASPVRVPGDELVPGLHYQANAVNMIAGNHAITPLTPRALLLVSLALVLAPLLLCALPAMRPMWRPLLACLVAAPALSLLLLWLGHTWFPPASALLVLLLGLLVWLALRMRRTQRQAQSDPLTHLANRTRFDESLALELRAAQRTGQPLSVMMLDIDYFKQLNDGHGHATGDAVLKALAGVLRERARRPRDLVARLGGDEFALLLPETGAATAQAMAEGILHDLATLDAQAPELPAFSVSIGIHCGPDSTDLKPAQMVQLADQALYCAKEQGRNRAHLG
jgi:diguanylate cyclase (GGDEF)-like protein